MAVSFTDLDDGLSVTRNSVCESNSDIKKRAHMANGGDALFDCPACAGRGRFISYAGRDVGACFKCKGKGAVGKRVIAAEKGKATKAANWAAYLVQHSAEIEHVRNAAGWSSFAASMCQNLRDERRFTENQLAAIRRMMAKAAERDEQREIDRTKRAESAPVVDLTAIDKLFATATDNQIKRPIFRTVDFDISKAPMTGRNAGALYVTARDDGKTYLGKLMNGKFHAAREAPVGTLEKLLAVAADPTGEAIKYGRKTGRCGCCNRVLVDPVSILAVVGPICARKWGLDYMRELAATEYANMRAEEIERISE